MVTTIHSLPPETLCLILAAIDPFHPEIAANLMDSPYPKRYSSLRSASLVCSAWRPIVQEELWRDVCLRSARARDAFTRVGGLYPVSRMIIEMEQGSGTRGWERVLSGLVGVEDLAINNTMGWADSPHMLDLECINTGGYRDLKSLSLEDIELVDTSLVPSPIVFNLTELRLWIGDWPLEPFRSVFARICRPSLRDLDIVSLNSAGPFTPSSTFPSLTTLTYHEFSPGRDPTSFPRDCTSLQHLSLSYSHHLCSIPVPLVTLSIGSWETGEDLVKKFKDNVFALSELKTLFLPRGEQERLVEMSSNWQEVKRICQAKGIEVRP